MADLIEDYAMIGDGLTAALVSKSGSIDWLCWPRFDSNSCFGRLVGDDTNGYWSIRPDGAYSVTRHYQDDTLVLETEFESATGVVRLVDFMPKGGRESSVIRIITGVSGHVDMRMEISPRFNYGAVSPWIVMTPHGFVGTAGPDQIALYGSKALEHSGHCVTGNFSVNVGERSSFVLRHGLSSNEIPPEIDPEAALVETASYWCQWIGRLDRPTEWPEAVKRSLITLKALVYTPTGGLIAAPTTSLPEAPGGDLNWDYRFSWIRDASFTLSPMLNAGFHEEARAWRDWILRAVGSEPEKMRIMYRADGSRHIPEWEIDWLDGYNHARPVRVGNAASTQRQADIYGELINAMHNASQAGIPRTEHSITIETNIIQYIEDTWQQPGAGLWESRDKARHYVYSRAMAWLGLDRYLSSDETRNCAGQARVQRWEALRDTIHTDVCTNGYHVGLGRFVEYYGGQTIDSSLLLLPLIGFLPVDDARIASTIEAVERELTEDGMVRRKKSTGSESEGSFIACTFWLADCQNLQGRRKEARKTFERALAVRNDVGLLSEEYNVPGRCLAGNFPQALSHLTLITTALGLSDSANQNSRF
jgi:GH15 family glucan-1,4-alpha-glucosidase